MALIRCGTSSGGGGVAYELHSQSITSGSAIYTFNNGFFAITCTDGSHPVYTGYVENGEYHITTQGDSPTSYATVNYSSGTLTVTKKGSKNLTFEVYTNE